MDPFGNGAENHSRLLQLFLKGCAYRHRVKDHINGHIGKSFLLIQRNAQSLKGLKHLGINFA